MEIVQDDIDWSIPGAKLKKIQQNIQGSPIAFVIGEDVVLTMAVDKEFAKMLLMADSFKENESTNEKDNVFWVDICLNNQTVSFRCVEMVYAILLSNPKIIEITESYKYYRHVTPNWKYINNDFILPGEME